MKKILRKKLLDKRKKKYIEISAKQTFAISELIKNKYKNIKVIGGYIPINYEYDCLNLLRILKKKNYTICLPVIKKNFPLARIHDYGKNLITPGFIDCHMHYPQTGIISSYGKRLIDWLNDYTFPEEKKFVDPEYASEIASLTLDICLQNGTTTVSSFCTSSPISVNQFFEEAKKREMCVVAGKT